MIDLIVRIVITAILAGLESLGPAHPDHPPTASAPSESATPDKTDTVPIASGSETAALLRAVDPCALHDVAAATRVTGHRATQIMPTESLASCRLRLHRWPFEPTWTVTTHVGVAYGAAQRHAAVPEEADGHRVYRDESTDPHARSCTYTRPMGPDHGISLTVDAPLDEPAAQPCPVARAYLTAARPLTHLVLRLEHRTEPRFALAALNPCAATRDVLRRLRVSGVAHPETPYRCRIQPDPPTIGWHQDPSVTITYGLGADPHELADAGTGHEVVTVADHTGIATMVGPEPQHCELTLAHDTTVAISLNHTSSCKRSASAPHRATRRPPWPRPFSPPSPTANPPTRSTPTTRGTFVMRWTHQHTCLSMLAVTIGIFAVAAVNPVDAPPDEVGRVGSGASVNSASEQPTTDGGPAPSTTRPVITLGNLDPPPNPPPP